MYTEEDIKGIVEQQRDFFLSGRTLDVSWRIAQLKRLKSAVIAYSVLFQQLQKLMKPYMVLGAGLDLSATSVG